MIWALPSVACFNSDPEDFKYFLRENGLTLETVADAKAQMDAEGIPEKQRDIKIKESKIEGLGAYTEADVNMDTSVGPVIIDGKWTSLGRYANHAWLGNCRPAVLDNGNILLIAKWPLKAGQEITVNYREMKKVLETIKTEGAGMKPEVAQNDR